MYGKNDFPSKAAATVNLALGILLLVLATIPITRYGMIGGAFLNLFTNGIALYLISEAKREYRDAAGARE